MRTPLAGVHHRDGEPARDAADVAEEPPDAGDRHRLSVVGGLAALSLDAMASVAYGPEAIVLMLALAGGAGMGFTLPVTLTIAALLTVLTLSYRQVIAAFPEGGGAYGGAYGVAKRHLGRRPSLIAAASLIVDYVLNVAVSVAVGVAALTSAFPELLPHTVWLCLAVLALITFVNYRGIAPSARLFIVPTVVYVGAIILVIVIGLLRDHPVTTEHAAPVQAHGLQTVGALLLLKAFANGCAALTGVEAIANAVPSFRRPRVKRAQRAEVALGALLALMLIGIALLIERFSVRPVDGVTVLSQVTEAAVGHGAGFYVVQFATVVLLALAANTSFGGLPVLARLLAADNNLPHPFALRAERQVHRYGIGFLAATSALLLVVARGDMNTLVPLFAIGVFVGFTLSQVGMVRHWLADRPHGWRPKALLNGLGALLTGVAAVVVTISKFTEGGWLILLALPALVVLMERIGRAYDRIGERLELGRTPRPPRPRKSLVVVPDRRDQRSLPPSARRRAQPQRPGGGRPRRPRRKRRGTATVPCRIGGLVARRGTRPARRRAPAPGRADRAIRPGSSRTARLRAHPELEPEHLWQRVLQNQRGAVLAHALRRDTEAVVCRLRFRLAPLPGPSPRLAQPMNT
ncbi:APC family permease [Actinomadura sp. NPDC023710]|uniref:APC family permease n=1 Tax=Actinomadura sp. NPDC023710 TaxID=3158219 RepID=UPI0033C06009